MDVGDAGLGGISESLPRLQALNLTKTRCADGTLAAVTKLTELRLLALQGTKITDKGLAVLKDGPATLESLDLSDTQCSNAGVPHLTRLGDLRTLDLSGTTVTDAGIEPLKHLPRLESLLAERAAVTVPGLWFVRQERRRLFPTQRDPLPPEQGVSCVWSTGRVGESGEDKIVYLEPLRPLQGTGLVCLNTTRFVALFAGITHQRKDYTCYTMPTYGNGWYRGRIANKGYEYAMKTFPAFLDIKLTAPNQEYNLQVHDKGNTLVINRTQKFDLRYEKKYILVEVTGKAREL
jgi:hypothetical protein